MRFLGYLKYNQHPLQTLDLSVIENYDLATIVPLLNDRTEETRVKELLWGAFTTLPGLKMVTVRLKSKQEPTSVDQEFNLVLQALRAGGGEMAVLRIVTIDGPRRTRQFTFSRQKSIVEGEADCWIVHST